MEDKEYLKKIINYWTDVELSSPPIIKTNNATKKSDSKWHQKIGFKNEDDVIWMSPLKEKIDTPNDWIHRIYLGIFNTEIVIEEFSEEDSDVNELKGKHHTCLVSFLLDGDGLPIKDTIVVPEYLSYIAYAKTNDKALYRSFEERIKDIFATWSFTIKKNKNCVDKNDLNEFIQQILLELNWELLADSFMNNRFLNLAYTESLSITKNRQLKFDSEITHSLIANDLKNVREHLSGEINKSSIYHYLNPEYDNIDRYDVINDRKHLRKEFIPENIPDVSWPVDDSGKLILSQQFAVNKILKEIDDKDSSLFSVNGPPGTGKTTLLRETIANIIYKRAQRLVDFEDAPDEALRGIGDITFKFSDKGQKTIYGLDEHICGFEIIVASSNNGAVQNITKELPLKKDISNKWHNSFQYIQEIGKNLNNDSETWGAIAATLGNKSNNYNFTSNFLFSNTNDEGETTRSIFDFLKNPHYFKDENVLEWKVACQKFKQQQRKVNKLKKEIEDIQYSIENFQSNYEKLKEINDLKEQTKKRVIEINQSIKELKNEYMNTKKELNNQKSITQTQSQNWINRLLKRNNNSNQEVIKKIKRNLFEKKEKVNKLLKERERLKDYFKKCNDSFLNQKEIVDGFKEVNTKKIEDNKTILKKDFWEMDESTIHNATPWLTNELNQQRIELFNIALEVHKSFIIENADKIASNLYCLKDVLNNDFHEKDEYTKSIWQTLFLIVPVVSTTFSSLGSLFESIKEGDLGWLLVDEAGQSTPQAPIGGLWRCKNTVIVGDPLQVEPIVNVEKKLSDVLLSKNEVKLDWNVCSYSAQQIADRGNQWGTFLKLGRRNIWVGSPLTVHRRCDDPMFSISNAIAYNNMMIYGKQHNQNESNEIQGSIGKSRWISIKDDANKDSHWIQNEGEKLIELLKNISKNSFEIPDFYVITPFKSVAFETNRMLKKRQNEWAPANASESDISRHINQSVGTIHTFQGKQAKTVFLLLGGNISKPGAITWACEEPNILNVACTRAKENFFIIGNPNVWNKGVFGFLKELIDIDKTNEVSEKSLDSKRETEESDDDLRDFMDDDINI